MRLGEHPTILVDHIDPLHELTGLVVTASTTIQVLFTLSCLEVDCLTSLLDCICILLIIVIGITSFHTRHAFISNQCRLSMREFLPGNGCVHFFTAIDIGKVATGIICKDPHEDRTSITGTIRSSIIRSSIQLLTLYHIHQIPLLLFFLLLLLSTILCIGIIVHTILHTLIHKAIILTLLKRSIIIISIVITSTFVTTGVFTIVILILLHCI
mmetsp:Transcript_8420/g.12097  ORF Transcript_8420/g.12097 Transcript_8420/m.12097 type:complete len:212 (+) Transcript_8420:268-903(+)